MSAMNGMCRTVTLLFLALLLAASPAAAERSYSFAYVRFADGRVTLQRASETEPEEVGVNYPVLRSDRIWTGTESRAEIEFADRSFLRLHERTKVDFLEFSESGGKENVLRQWSGSTFMRWSGEPGERFRIDTPAGSVFPVSRGLFRIDVHEGGDAVTLSTYEGVAELASEGGSVLLRSGQRSVARGVERPEAAFDFNTAHADAFARWSDERDRRLARARHIAGLPEEVEPYASELDDYGYWQYDVTYGNVWFPVAGVGWSPYTYGRWWYTPSFGWTWCSYEPWGWAPYHYGRWGFNTHGWFWIPGVHWGPAWVSWAIGPSWVGWCPLGYYNRPVFHFDSAYYRGGRAVPRQQVGNGWSFARAQDFSGSSGSSVGQARLRAEDVRSTAREARLFESGAILDRDLRPRSDPEASLNRGNRFPRESGEADGLGRGPTAVTRAGEAGRTSPQPEAGVGSSGRRIGSLPGDIAGARVRSRAREGTEPGARERWQSRDSEDGASERLGSRPRFRDPVPEPPPREPRAVRPGEIRRAPDADSSTAGDSPRRRSGPESTRGESVMRRLFSERPERLDSRAEGTPSAEGERGEAGRSEEPAAAGDATQGGIERNSRGRRLHSQPLGRAREPHGRSGGEDVGGSRSTPPESGSSERSYGRAREMYRSPPTSGRGSRGDGGGRDRSMDRGSSRSSSRGGSSSASGGSAGAGASRPSGGGGAASTRRSRERD